MRKLWLILGILIFAPAIARSNLELGIFIGGPTGISVAYNEFQGVLAWDLDKHTHLFADWMFYNTSFTSLPLIFSVGAGISFRVGGASDKKNETEAKIGARLPLDLSYYIKKVPLHIFLEVAPVFYVLESTGFDINGGIGIRYVF